MNYKTYSDLSVDILQNISKIPAVDLIIGIPRSGMIPAYMIGAHLNLPVVTLSDFLRGEFIFQGQRQLNTDDFKNVNKVLVVDDSIDSGFAMSKARKEIEKLDSNLTIYYAAVYASNEINNDIDFHFHLLKQPRIFQWNYKNHFIATKSCYDIDGVLCVDPTDKENDDSINYSRFLKNAKPLYIPKRKISCLVTSRLEKYRKETEDWLSRFRIKYDELIMMNLETAQQRRALGNHGEFKGEIYKNRNEELFIESNWEQAKLIFNISNKPVICISNDVMIKNYADIVYYENQLARNQRSLSSIFSESGDMELKYQTLFKEHEDLRILYNKLKIKLKRLESNKWIQFSRLPTRKKLLRLFTMIFTRK